MDFLILFISIGFVVVVIILGRKNKPHAQPKPSRLKDSRIQRNSSSGQSAAGSDTKQQKKQPSPLYDTYTTIRLPRKFTIETACTTSSSDKPDTASRNSRPQSNTAAEHKPPFKEEQQAAGTGNKQHQHDNNFTRIRLPEHVSIESTPGCTASCKTGTVSQTYTEKPGTSPAQNQPPHKAKTFDEQLAEFLADIDRIVLTDSADESGSSSEKTASVSPADTSATKPQTTASQQVTAGKSQKSSAASNKKPSSAKKAATSAKPSSSASGSIKNSATTAGKRKTQKKTDAAIPAGEGKPQTAVKTRKRTRKATSASPAKSSSVQPQAAPDSQSAAEQSASYLDEAIRLYLAAEKLKEEQQADTTHTAAKQPDAASARSKGHAQSSVIKPEPALSPGQPAEQPHYSPVPEDIVPLPQDYDSSYEEMRGYLHADTFGPDMDDDPAFWPPEEPFIQLPVEQGNQNDWLEQLATERKPDWPAFKQVLDMNGISCLYHFTDRRNIQSIKRQGGLFSWYYCLTHNIVIPNPGGDEYSRGLDAYYGLKDYVRLSFCEGHPMSYRLKKSGAEVVILRISAEVALLRGTLFSDINAADKYHRHGGSIADLNRVNFNAVKRLYVYRTDSDFKAHQAEVMVRTFIPARYILNLYDF